MDGSSGEVTHERSFWSRGPKDEKDQAKIHEIGFRQLKLYVSAKALRQETRQLESMTQRRMTGRDGEPRPCRAS